MENVKRSTTGKRLDWDDWYWFAGEYYKSHGNLLVPIDYETEDGYKLGKWISRQRAKYNNASYIKGGISKTEIQLLENIGMVWRLEYRFKWQDWINELNTYREAHGDILVPREYKQGVYHLGNWIVEKRKLYWKGELLSWQIDELNELGMEWAVSFKREWMDWYEDARTYYEEHGDLLVPADYITDEGFRLGVWISELRGKYSHRKGKRSIKADEVELLNHIGMIWDIKESRDSHWEEMYEAAKKYVEVNGKLPVNEKNAVCYGGKRLDYWISTQKQYLDEGKHTEEKIARLAELGIFPRKKRKVVAGK